MAAAFDPIAAQYDEEFTDTATGQLQRAQVYAHLQEVLTPQTYILELSCGTGADARWLARQGHRVLATDASRNMVEATQAKLNTERPVLPVETTVLKAEHLAQRPVQSPLFDLVFSNFAGLNCVAPEDWPALAQACSDHTTDQGHLALVLLGRCCWWETVYYLLRGQWKKAWRRRQKGPVSAPLSADSAVDIWYYSPREISDFCTPNFEVQGIYPIGLLVPPSYLDNWFARRPGLLRSLASLDRRLAKWQGGAQWSDHYLVILKKRDHINL